MTQITDILEQYHREKNQRSLVYGWHEPEDEAIERAKSLYIHGLIPLHELERRLGTIMRREQP